VKDFAGQYSSMPLYLSGSEETVMVNRAHRRSKIFDTDGDGVANGFDPTPFGDGRPKMQLKGRFIEWLGIPNKMYSIEYTEKLGKQARWRKLVSIKNNKTVFESMRYQIPRALVVPDEGSIVEDTKKLTLKSPAAKSYKIGDYITVVGAGKSYKWVLGKGAERNAAANLSTTIAGIEWVEEKGEDDEKTLTLTLSDAASETVSKQSVWLGTGAVYIRLAHN
jgi:hypothetical protein